MNRSFIKKMYSAGNIKLRGQNAGFSSVPVRSNTGPRVRGMPASVKSGIGHYKSASASVSKNTSYESKSWLDDYDRFAQLRKVGWTKDSESNSTLSMIEEYLKSIQTLYGKVDSVSCSELEEKLNVVREQWMNEHGSLPEPTKGKSMKVKQMQRTETSNGNGELKAGGTVISIRSPEEEAKRKLQKEYEGKLRQVEENHFPMVYAKPGTPNFAYLCNSIRLMTAKRTICFSLDVEAYEFDNNVVTEIGIAIYDPRENSHSIVPMTRNYHLIISEALPLRNKKFVCDFKECFLLGESLVMSLPKCVEFVQALVDFYMKPKTPEDRTWARAFVGHNVLGDLKWMRNLGVKIPETDSMDHSLLNLFSHKSKNSPILVLDTEKLYRFCYGNKGGNLGRLLRLFKIPHAFLHNAGNDSHYTLQLLMHMCDVSFRKQAGLDDLLQMSIKIRRWIEREKQEPKILPMSYALSVVEATKKRSVDTRQENNTPRKRQARNLVPQTEFGGSQYFVNARDAFQSTLEL